MDFYDAKGAVEAVLHALHVDGVRFVPAEALPPYGYMYCHHFNEPKPLPGGLRG